MRPVPSIVCMQHDMESRAGEIRRRCIVCISTQSRLSSQKRSVLISKEERLFIHRFTSRPPEPERVFRWKSEMATEERSAFVGVARPLLEALGYET